MVSALRARGVGLEFLSFFGHAHPTLVSCLSLACNVKAIGPHPHFHPRLLPVLNLAFQPLLRTFPPPDLPNLAPRILSEVPSPPYLVTATRTAGQVTPPPSWKRALGAGPASRGGASGGQAQGPSTAQPASPGAGNPRRGEARWGCGGALDPLDPALPLHLTGSVAHLRAPPLRALVSQ